MVQMQWYYVMAYVMWFCLFVETAERACEMTHPAYL